MLLDELLRYLSDLRTKESSQPYETCMCDFTCAGQTLHPAKPLGIPLLT